MARTATITDEQILVAARELFVELGMQATTAEIARHAGISEGSIFRRYPTKHHLFLAAMGVPEPVFFDQIPAMAGQGDLHETLYGLGSEIVDFFLELIPKTMLVVSSGLVREANQDPDEVLPVKVLRKVTNFFAEEMRLGRLESRDPEVLARMFMGSLHHYAFAETCGINRLMPMPKQTYIRGIVDLLINQVGEGGRP